MEDIKRIDITLAIILTIALLGVALGCASYIALKDHEQRLRWNEESQCQQHNATLINNDNQLLTCQTYTNQIIHVPR